MLENGFKNTLFQSAAIELAYPNVIAKIIIYVNMSEFHAKGRFDRVLYRDRFLDWP